MASTPSKANDTVDARAPVSPDELSQALAIEVYDREGKTIQLGELVKGKRTALIFIRHFWCVNCHAYVRYLSASLPPENLPSNTQVLIIGCGQYQPIDNFVAASSCKYPVYSDPSNRLHAILKFKWTLQGGRSGDPKKDYMSEAGSVLYRIFGGITYGLKQLHHNSLRGPNSLNGGEVVVSADGKCEFVHRMQNTEDHADVSELASVLGAKFDGAAKYEKPDKACGESCAVDPAEA